MFGLELGYVNIEKKGYEYEGQFKDGEFHGHGKIKTDEGEVYEGNFKNGDFNGYGTFTWKDGK